MAKHNIVDLIGILTLFLFGITMICQGHFIFHGKHGYKHCDRDKQKSENTRRRVEELLKDK
jgi:hypothetical protein